MPATVQKLSLPGKHPAPDAPAAAANAVGDNAAAPRGPSILPLECRGLCYQAHGRLLLDNLDFRLAHGKRTVILGANGAGKSLLLRLVHGLLRPSRGDLRWLGPNAGATRPPLPNGAAGGDVPPRARLRFQAMVFQRPVMMRRSVRANILYPLRLHGLSRAAAGQRADTALQLANLVEQGQRPATLLSGGEQQRLAMARAWVLHPELLLLDEPAANLDPAATRQLEAMIAAMHAEGVKIVMSTHDISQAQRLADEILFLHRGRILEQSDAALFFHRPSTPQGRMFLDDQPNRQEVPDNKER